MAAFSSSVEFWRKHLEGPAREHGIPMDFLLAYIRKESGGNPCSTGFIRNGFNVEAGIGQVYFDGADERVFGTTSAELRANCVGTTSKQSGSMSAEQLAANVSSLVAQVQHHRKVSRAELDAIGADWPESSSDFWMLVKLQHGLPGVPKKLLPQYVKAIGHVPPSWAVWREWIESLDADELGPVLVRWAGAPLRRILTNAESVGSMTGGVLPSIELAPLIVPLLVVALAGLLGHVLGGAAM